MTTTTTMFDEAQLEALRGGLQRSNNSARDLATTTQTRCTRRRALAVAGASPEHAAEILGKPARYGQSPFAFEVGQRFEGSLRKDHYGRLLAGLREQLGLPQGAVSVEDLDRDLPWPKQRTQHQRVAAKRRARTDEILEVAIKGKSSAPVVVLHPRLELVVTDSVRDVEPDGLLIWPESSRPRLVEVKAYADHGHRTDLSDLAKTRQQLAVYFVAMQQAVDRLCEAGRIKDRDAAHAALVGPWPNEKGVRSTDIRAVTILRRPGSMQPAIAIEDIRRDVDLVRRGLARTPATLAEILAELPPNAKLDDPATLRSLPVSYEPAWCLGNCPLTLGCREDAERDARPDYFGGNAVQVLAPAGDVRSAHAMALGKARPVTPEQAAFAVRAQPLRARIDLARKQCGC